MDDAALLALAADLTRRAGAAILAVRARGFETLRKLDASPVTAADHAAEAVIVEGLRAAAPEIAVVAEEEIAAGHLPQVGREFWLVDPLDGTREFAALRDEFTVNIGLVRDGRAVLGAVGVPAYGELFLGQVGRGAWKRTAAGEHAIRARAPPPDGLHVLASRSHGSDARLTRFLEGRPIAIVTNMGSALKVCRLAEGAGDLYPRFGRTMEWGHGRAPGRARGRGRRDAQPRRRRDALRQARLGEPRLRLHRLLGLTEVLADDGAGLDRAAMLLRDGQLVAFATETVYGLGADARNARAVAAVFDAKGRPHFNPLICHYPDADAAFAHVEAPALARRLAAAFWPGPLTLVLSRRVTCPVALLAGAGLETLAVRVPAHPAALALLRRVGGPVAAPSANRSGQVSPTTAAHVLDGLDGRIAAVVDSGPCPIGVESTVLDLTSERPFVLRPGGVPREALEDVAGPVAFGVTRAQAEETRTLRSPGLLVSHYAPRLPVRLDAQRADADEALLAFGTAQSDAGAVFQLSQAGDLAEAAARLFAGLRWLDVEGDRLGLTGIAAMPVPREGLGLAINDRLERAAAPRGR